MVTVIVGAMSVKNWHLLKNVNAISKVPNYFYTDYTFQKWRYEKILWNA